MTQIDWTDRLSEYLDGTLTRDEHDVCEAWLASNAEGRALLADLRRVVAKAKTLPDVAVPDSIWAGVASGMATQRKPAETPVVPITSRGPAPSVAPAIGRRWSFTPMQFAAAAVILVVIGAGVGSQVRRVPVVGALAPADSLGFGRPEVIPAGAILTPSDRSYYRAVQDLQLVLDQNRGRLDPATIRVLEQSLSKIDAAISEAQQALAADPKSQYLNDHLTRIRRQKLDLLRQGTALIRAS